MVLESVINPKNAEDKPWHIFFIAFIYSIIAIVFSQQLFPVQASILAVMLITVIFIPFFQKLFYAEEEKEDLAAEGRLKGNIFQRHEQSIKIFSAFFLGVTVSMSVVFIFFGYENVFLLQSQWFENAGTFPTGTAAAEPINFSMFFANNTQVMLLMFILSLIFGAGAIFILVWNASIIAVFVGLFSRTLGDGTAAQILGIPIGLTSIALHGIPEIAAYFFAGLAGGILSVGLIKERFGSREFHMILKDSLLFLVTAEALIFIAAMLEVFV